MLFFNWSTVVRNWFSQVGQTRTASRPSLRRRPRQLPPSTLEQLEERLVLSAIVVTSTGDAILADGFVTLREALVSMNGAADVNVDVAAAGAYGINDTITFNIPGAGLQTISPVSALPTLLTPVAIDGYSQPGASVNTLATTDNAVLLIQLDGTLSSLGSNGLVFAAGSDGSSVMGLVINSFSGSGIVLQSDANTITGNFLGTNAAGDTGVSAAGAFGIGITGASRNTIGGTLPAARNIIGGNSDGINLGTGTQNTVIQGNFIGVGADGTTAVGNRLHGVALQGNGGLGVQNNLIGGTPAGAGNTIANNGRAGIAVFGDALALRQNTGNAILGNSIFNNGLDSPATLPGIDLVGTLTYPTDDGPTANDLGDGDSGPNLGQNFPVLTSATTGPISTTIQGSLNSNSNTTYRIEFFSSPTLSGTGFGEGQTFLGFVNVTTDSLGNALINATLGAVVPNGQFVTATATSEGTSPSTGATGAASHLGTAASFVALAGSTMTITGPTTLIGDVGVSPGTVITGTFATTGTIHVADAVASQAQTDLVAGYNFYAGLTPFIDLTGQELGGLVLTPGVYHFDTSAQLTGPLPLTLNAQGDPHAQFVFQIGSTLTTAAGVGSAVVVIGGSSDNIVWQVGSSATIGVGTQFVGNILALTSITFETGATLAYGRALARNGAVTLDSIFADVSSPPQSNTSEFSAPAQISIPTVTLSVAPATLVEATGQSTVTATLSAVSGLDVIVDLVYTGTATNITDYTRSGSQIVILAGQLTGTVTLTAVQDLLNESDETIIVDINGVTNGTESGTQQVTATILDDDAAAAPDVTLSILPATMVEAAGASTVTATLSALSGQDVTIDLAFAGTATNITDYTRSGTQIVILAGQLTGSVTLTAVQDLLVEGDETIIVDITGVTNGTEATAQQVTATILDDDVVPAPSVTLSVAPATLAEAAGTSTVTATLSVVSAQDVTIDLVYSGTATNIVDYTRSGTQIVILAGQLTGTVTLDAVQDAVVETDETIIVDINGVTNGTENGTQQVTATILDDDVVVPGPSVTLSVVPATILEAAGTSTVTATLSVVSAQDVTVDLAFSGTATNIVDYTRSATQIVILAGQLTGTVSLNAVQDALIEGDETIIVDINGVTNGTENGTQQVTATIVDDDVVVVNPAVTLNIAPGTLVEAGGTSIVTATLSGVSAQDVTIDLVYSGTATNVVDYTRSGTQIVILAGQLTGTVSLTAVQDALVEGDETIIVDINAVTNGTENGTQQVTATIIDDDVLAPAPSVTLTLVPATLVEAAGAATVTATLSAISAQDVTIDLTYSGTATNVADYSASGAQIVITAGNLTGSVVLTAVQDLLNETAETIIVDISGVTNGTESGSQQVIATILDDDAIPSLSITDVTVLEGSSGTFSAVFTVTLSASSGQTVTVVATSADNTANSPTDYTALPPTTLTFAPGETSQTVSVAVNGDLLVEANETYFINLSGALNATIADGQGLGTITNDDSSAPPVITSPATASVAENTLAATVILDVNATPVVGQSFTYALSGPDTLLFNINSATGELTFVTSPNYEAPADQGADNVYNVSVTVTSDVIPSGSIVQDLTITVTPVNDLDPVFVDASPTFSIPENSAVGTLVGAVAATDGDLPAQTVTYSIVSGNESGAFAINPTTGEITVADSVPLDLDVTTSFTLTVRVIDSVSPLRSADAMVVVNVTDVQGSPTITIPRAQGIFHMGRIPAFVSPDSSFTYGDVANPDYSNAKLTVSIVTNRDRRDRLNIFPKGNDNGQIGLKGHKVLFGGKVIGTFTGGRGNAHPDLVITFNSQATTSAVDNLMRRLNFHVDTSVGVTRTVNMQVTNISGVDSNLATRDIAVVDIR